MSALKTLLGLVPTLLGFGARMVGIKRGPDVAKLVAKHYYPPYNSVEEWQVGPDTCYYCLRRDPNHTAVTDPPCPKRRTSREELA